MIDVTARGVRRDGSNQTKAIAPVFAEADGSREPLYFPSGDYLFDTQLYRGQSIIGDGPATRLRSLPGRDLFYGDQTIGPYAREGAVLRDFWVTVDDTIDATGSFKRSGAGNAGFAFEWQDGAVGTGLRWSDVDLQRIRIRSLSQKVGGQNGSCGLYLQHNADMCGFRKLFFSRLAYGHWEDWPAVNVLSAEHAGDHNHWDTIGFDACGKAFRVVNAGYCQFTNVAIHGGPGCTDGFAAIAVAGKSRQNCWNLEISNMMIESQTNRPWDVHGGGLDVRKLYIAGDHSTVKFETTTSTYENMAVFTGDYATAPTIAVTGSNDMRGVGMNNGKGFAQVAPGSSVELVK